MTSSSPHQSQEILLIFIHPYELLSLVQSLFPKQEILAKPRSYRQCSVTDISPESKG
jgi:hypothetical protein